MSVAVVGAVGAPFGVHGWVHVRSFTAPPGNLLAYRPWQLESQAVWREVRATARAHGAGFVARFDDVTDRDAACRLRGANIGVAARLLPPAQPGEHYWRDLVGRRVVSSRANGASGQSLGVVARVFATPAHDVLVVEDGSRERLIPFVRQVVLEVNEEQGCVVVDWDADWQ